LTLNTRIVRIIRALVWANGRMTQPCYFDNIGAEDVKLILLKQTYKSFLFIYEVMDLLSTGGVQQAQQSTHLAEGLNPL